MPRINIYPWKHNKGCEQPRQIVCLHTESIKQAASASPGYEAHRLRCGYAELLVYGDKGWQTSSFVAFDNEQSWWAWLYMRLRRKNPTVVYGHGLAGQLTWLGVWSRIESGTLRIAERGRPRVNPKPGQSATTRPWTGRTALDGMPFILECRQNGGPVRFVDVLNYYEHSLDALATAARMAWPVRPDESDDIHDWTDHCHRVCDVIISTMTRLMSWWKEHDLGNWQSTLASLAWSSYRHRHGTGQVVCHGDLPMTDAEKSAYRASTGTEPMDSHCVSAVERDAYFGGRVWVGYVGDVRPGVLPEGGSAANLWKGRRPVVTGPVYHFDVNSLYPYVMREREYPVELIDCIHAPPLERAVRCVTDYQCIARVLIDSPIHVYPLRRDGRVSWVTGRYVTALCGQELRQAVNAGDVRDVSDLCIYRSGKPFESFVGQWGPLKEEASKSGDMVTEKFCKGVMNALYGKCAQRRPVWTTMPAAPALETWGTWFAPVPGTAEVLPWRGIGGVPQVMLERRDCRHTCTFVAAFVTMYGRMLMDQLRAMCGPRQCLYQDTDSLLVLRDGAEALMRAAVTDQYRMGMLKLVGIYEFMDVYGPRNYQRDDENIVAGLKSDAELIGDRAWKTTKQEDIRSIISRRPDGSVLRWSALFQAPGVLHGYGLGIDGWTYPAHTQ